MCFKSANVAIMNDPLTKYATNWKLFSVLLSASAVTALMVLPYAFALMSDKAPVITPVLVIAQMIQASILFAIAIYFGLRLAKRVGFGLPILEGALKGDGQTGSRLKSVLWLSVGLGALASALIVAISIPFESLSVDFLKAEVSIPAWKSLLASFYGGIAEEVLLRLFLMTFFVWITFKIWKTSEGKPTAAGIWLSIIVSSVIFGLGHLPITGSVTAITPMVVLRAILLNGVGGVIFGWLYWKKGLESAMISHFSADICLHVILPFVAVLFLK
jgi:membrane protease YdiL (CAAX protease family)